MPTLSKAIAGKYDYEGTPGKVEVPRKDANGQVMEWLRVDLAACTLAQAEALVRAGFEQLKKKPAPKTK